MERDYLDMFRALNAEGARYLLVGAHAVAVYGVPRATGDMDLGVTSSRARRGGIRLRYAPGGTTVELAKASYDKRPREMRRS